MIYFDSRYEASNMSDPDQLDSFKILKMPFKNIVVNASFDSD
jgi:hypothetical protein